MKKNILVSLAIWLVLLTASFPLASCKGGMDHETSYEIECKLEGNTLTGKERVCFYNSSDTAFSELKFNLFANAYRENAKYRPVQKIYEYLAYPEGKNFGGIEILSVKSDCGDLSFKVAGEDENILIVSLDGEVFPEEKTEVLIEYKITLANIVARLGINAKTVNLAEFYPILCGIDKDGFYECLYYPIGDPYFSECADYSVKFTADEKYTVAHAGEKVSASTENGKTTYDFSLKKARSFCMVLSENFETISANAGDITVNYFYYDDENALASSEYAIKALKTFSALYGDYAYKTFSVVETPFVQGGMEFPTIVMISDSVEKDAYGEVIVHETAHQWWQTTVGNNEIEYGFLDEGLAEYSTVLFYENNPEYNMKREYLMDISDKTYKSYCTVYEKLFGEKDTSMTRSLKDFTSEYEYVNIAYVKACIMYDELRKSIGDEKFFKGLKNYYSENKLKVATPYDLISAFTGAGADAEGFINGFLSGKAII